MPQHLTISYKLESTNPDLHMKENTLLTCVHHLVFGSPPPLMYHPNSRSYKLHRNDLLDAWSPSCLILLVPSLTSFVFSISCAILGISIYAFTSFQFEMWLSFPRPQISILCPVTVLFPPTHSVIPQIFFQLSSDPTRSWVFWTLKTSAQAEVNLICICKTKGLCSPSCPLTFPAIEGFAKHLFASHF